MLHIHHPHGYYLVCFVYYHVCFTCTIHVVIIDLERKVCPEDLLICDQHQIQRILKDYKQLHFNSLLKEDIINFQSLRDLGTGTRYDTQFWGNGPTNIDHKDLLLSELYKQASFPINSLPSKTNQHTSREEEPRRAKVDGRAGGREKFTCSGLPVWG